MSATWQQVAKNGLARLRGLFNVRLGADAVRHAASAVWRRLSAMGSDPVDRGGKSGAQAFELFDTAVGIEQRSRSVALP